ncbi:orotidine-5'-phosphate decarboxylase [Granulicella sp. WH15]|uniref:orotidine-5'-phosphate decarboxylase n=1 Tax=Granulicella sp. WH15 TaxID=2602070 RepID=UPI0013A5327F|nr:orotidine-5'-phosphate decarboxylase [Granulicella sp. WH15]
MNMRFAEQVRVEVERKGNAACVGIDPALERMAGVLLASCKSDGGGQPDAEELLTRFGRLIVDAVADLVPVVKPQSAYFERFGPAGMRALETVMRYAKKKGLLVVLDVKRGDIGETSSAYAEAYLGNGPWAEMVDCLTLAPYMGPDSLEPFARVAMRTGKGLFVCVRTSNPGAAYLQNLIAEGKPVYAHVAEMVAGLAERQGVAGYSDMGAVVGATLASEAREIRAMLPKSLFLVPGLGAQGGSLAVVRDCFDADGGGAIVSSSRGVNYPVGEFTSLDQLGEAVRQAARSFVQDVQSCRTAVV